MQSHQISVIKKNLHIWDMQFHCDISATFTTDLLSDVIDATLNKSWPNVE